MKGFRYKGYCTVRSKPAGGSGCDRKMLPGGTAEALLSL